MAPPTQVGNTEALEGPRLEAAISTAIVQALRQRTGRGPTRARTTLGENLVVCILAATLTTGEHSLVANGDGELVLRVRRAYQEVLRDQMITSVEDLSGREVIAFMSADHLEPELATEIFVLKPVEQTIA
jgi:uncharacterized protein YbcI